MRNVRSRTATASAAGELLDRLALPDDPLVAGQGLAGDPAQSRTATKLRGRARPDPPPKRTNPAGVCASPSTPASAVDPRVPRRARRRPLHPCPRGQRRASTAACWSAGRRRSAGCTRRCCRTSSTTLKPCRQRRRSDGRPARPARLVGCSGARCRPVNGPAGGPRRAPRWRASPDRHAAAGTVTISS